MTESVDDGTEGGYTAYPAIPADELEALRQAHPQFFTTDVHMALPSMTEEYAKELIEKYGHVESTVSIDMDDFGFFDIDDEHYGKQ